MIENALKFVGCLLFAPALLAVMYGLVWLWAASEQAEGQWLRNTLPPTMGALTETEVQ